MKWIDVKVRHMRTMENGTKKKVRDLFMAQAMTCAAAERRVVEELLETENGDISVSSATKTKIAEVVPDAAGAGRWYRVRYAIVTINERTKKIKRHSEYTLVQASDFADAIERFNLSMKGTIVDWETEAVQVTDYADVLPYVAPKDNANA